MINEHSSTSVKAIAVAKLDFNQNGTQNPIEINLFSDDELNLIEDDALLVPFLSVKQRDIVGLHHNAFSCS